MTYSEKTKFQGTPLFCSLNALKHMKPSRRDDLEALGFVLVFLCGRKSVFAAFFSVKLLQSWLITVCVRLPKCSNDGHVTSERLCYNGRVLQWGESDSHTGIGL